MKGCFISTWNTENLCGEITGGAGSNRKCRIVRRATSCYCKMNLYEFWGTVFCISSILVKHIHSIGSIPLHLVFWKLICLIYLNPPISMEETFCMNWPFILKWRVHSNHVFSLALKSYLGSNMSIWQEKKISMRYQYSYKGKNCN